MTLITASGKAEGAWFRRRHDRVERNTPDQDDLDVDDPDVDDPDVDDPDVDDLDDAAEDDAPAERDVGRFPGAGSWMGAPTVLDPVSGEVYDSADVLIDPV